MTRKECLEQAAKCVLKDRNNEYGGPEDNFGRIALLWTDYLGVKLDAVDVAMMMALLKIARVRNNKVYWDGFCDLAGYAACGAELASAMKAREDATREAGEEYRKLKPAPAPKNGDELVVLWKHKPKAEANHPENPDSSPAIKPGDKVQVRIPTADGDRWDDAQCVSLLSDGTGIRVNYAGYQAIAFGWMNVRPAPKAEGCEELVRKDDVFDAPQTTQGLYQRIVDANPATFKPRTPTGEELAEMAEAEEEKAHG